MDQRRLARLGRISLRTAGALLVLLTFASVPAAQKKQQAVKATAEAWAEDAPAVPEELSTKIDEAAAEFRGRTPLPRAGFFEVSYPSNVEEYVALAGNGALLITLFAQDKNELPIRKAYFNFEGSEVELRQVASVLSKRKESESKTSKAFGAYRMDALYLFPLHLGFDGANLLVEFAKTRNGFRLGAISGSTLAVREHEQTRTLADKPSDEALKLFVEREYPGFLMK